MTPKERALKLVDKFQDKAIDFVQILIDSYKAIYDDFVCDKESYGNFSFMRKYWEEVKKEIEKIMSSEETKKNMKKITQEMLDNNIPVKPNNFGLRKLGIYLIIFIILEACMLLFYYFLSYLANIPVTKEGVGVLSSLVAVFSLAVLTESSVLVLPQFIVKIIGFKSYVQSVDDYNKLEEEFERQQNYLRLHELYKDIT